MCVHAQSCLTLCNLTPLTAAHQASLSMGFSRQDDWSGLPFPSPGDLPDPGIEPESPELAGRFFTAEPPGKPVEMVTHIHISAFLDDSVVKTPPSMQETQFQSLGQEGPLEKEVATHSNILTWRIPWTESLGATVHGVTKNCT